jgi:ribosomal protein L40E
MRDVANGQVVHGHKLLEKIGEGAYGEVWRAEYLDHPVALKLFNRGRRPAHLRRELFAQYALGRLDGAEARWFPRVDHIDLDAEPPYMRMELIDGVPLEELLGNPTLSLEARLGIGEKVLEALAVVHAHDFAHGDLSPQNVLVAPDHSVRLIDVGYGALFEDAADITVSTSAEDAPSGVASPLYSAPERFKTAPAEGFGKPSDIFSFGKLLYRLITSEQPFVIKPVSLKFRALGTKWDDFLFRCLEERPETRFADAATALAEYRRISRVELAPGEYRAECAECGADQSIPGGWAGERFDCRRCSRTIEVLFYDDVSRYATTAVVNPVSRPEPPPILFLEEEADARTKKFCLQCGGEMRPAAKKCRHCGAWVEDQARRIRETASGAARFPSVPARSYVLPVVVTALAYFLFWVPGAILNWYFLDDARRVENATGRTPSGVWALRLMMCVLVYLPFLALAAFTVLGLFGALLFALFA